MVGQSLMAGKRGLIMGVANNRSIAYSIAKACSDAGAEIALTYQGEQFKKRVEPLAEELGAIVAGHCDVTDMESLDAVFDFVNQRVPLAFAFTLAANVLHDAADAVAVRGRSSSVSVRLGKVESTEASEGDDMSLRVFVGKRVASVSATASSDPKALAERAVAMAKVSPDDPYQGLADSSLLATAPRDLDLYDATTVSAADLKADALAAEEAALAVTGVTNSSGSGASAGLGGLVLATSHGFLGHYVATRFSRSVSVIAGEGAAMQRDYGWHSAHHLSDLESVAAIGTRAGTRAVARLNPGKAPVGKVPVLFDPRVSGGIVGHLLAAIAGPAIARGTSFLLGKEEQALFDSSILIHDDPHRPRGLRSRAFDGEGLPTAPRDIVTGGKITGWLLDTASAKQLGLQPTGHASRGGGAAGVTASNLHLAAGAQSPEALMADIGEGVYLTELIGHGVNPVTGDYSRGASGFLIRDGRIDKSVQSGHIALSIQDLPAIMRILQKPCFFQTFLQASLCIFNI